jgi:hypothetical protein
MLKRSEAKAAIEAKKEPTAEAPPQKVSEQDVRTVVTNVHNTTSPPLVGDEGTEVTISYGEETYSPVQFNAFKHGPFFVKVKVRPGETIQDAGARAWNAAIELAKGAYPGKEQAYLANLRKLGLLVGDNSRK